LSPRDANTGIRFGNVAPAVQAFPEFLAENKYQDVKSANQTAFQRGHNTDLPAFIWMQDKPRLMEAMSKTMTAIAPTDWADNLVELHEAAAKESGTSTRPPKAPSFFVDVGGGHGRRSADVLAKFPHLAGRIVSQDLPDVLIPASDPPEGMVLMAQDFFQPQSEATVGARFYHLGNVLHDWPDEDCLRILKNVRDAMSSTSEGQPSTLLIDEIVLPDSNAPWQAAMADMIMGIALGGRERTRSAWDNLLARADFKITRLNEYGGSGGCRAVMVVQMAYFV
jgi:demethylsterigmatocystin 6-O-methyltransferase